MTTLVKRAREFARNFRVDDGSKFKLKEFDPNETLGLKHREGIKDLAAEALQEGTELLAEMQEKLYAQDRWGLLLIFQAMDAAGKDGAIKHVMSGVNPQGCQVFSFKTPSAEELDHDFLWRTNKCIPERGRIGIFNRSYYEEVLVVRVHPEFLEKQKMPARLVGRRIWDERYEDIAAHERYLARNGVRHQRLDGRRLLELHRIPSAGLFDTQHAERDHRARLLPAGHLRRKLREAERQQHEVVAGREIRDRLHQRAGKEEESFEGNVLAERHKVVFAVVLALGGSQ